MAETISISVSKRYLYIKMRKRQLITIYLVPLKALDSMLFTFNLRRE